MRLFETESSPFSFQQVRGGGSLIDREKPKKKKKTIVVRHGPDD